MEQGSVEEQLAIGDGDHVGGDELREIVVDRLQDGHARQGSAIGQGEHPRESFEDGGVDVEYVGGKGLPGRHRTEDQCQLTITLRVLQQVIECQDHVVSGVPVVLASDHGHHRQGEGQRGWRGGAGGQDHVQSPVGGVQDGQLVDLREVLIESDVEAE